MVPTTKQRKFTVSQFMFDWINMLICFHFEALIIIKHNFYLLSSIWVFSTIATFPKAEDPTATTTWAPPSIAEMIPIYSHKTIITTMEHLQLPKIPNPAHSTKDLIWATLPLLPRILKYFPRSIAVPIKKMMISKEIFTVDKTHRERIKITWLPLSFSHK